jgi:UDP-N-acetylglucosamine 2-epimerase (non-hydrolysing)
MTRRIHALVVIGTRPEAIKLAPVVRELQRRRRRFRLSVCGTAQHRQLLDQAAEIFRIPMHYDLNVMTRDQRLEQVTARIVLRFSEVLRRARPDVILTQGDTTTTFVASLAGFYHRIPVGHVEAGLRTYDRFAPFPEEINRRLTTHVADYHYAPTEWARRNLIREGIPATDIVVTGNTVVDTFVQTWRRVRHRTLRIPSLRNVDWRRRIILVTAHRRENFGPGLRNICTALRQIAARRDDVEIVYPVHPNPNVRSVAEGMLGDVERVHLTPPLDYLPFVWLMTRAHLALTDSGGIQEEMPSLGRPVLVARNETERPEGVRAGVCKLVGTNPATILRAVLQLLDDPRAYAAYQLRKNPFGDGRAARRIVRHLASVLRPRR